jgi:BirA family transcriptional regulator, biotin operon repressor / biotin---[acetyl-CoA-carboxylase] ligase
MVLRPAHRDAGAASALPLLVGHACARALREATGLPVGIEWPNDLVVGDRKLGGILCEAAHANGRLDFVVAGIGINVAALPADLDDATRSRATSLADLQGAAAPARVDIAGAIAARLKGLHADASIHAAELAELRALDSLFDRPVRFGTGREGIARGILPDGALAVDADGERLEIRAGSVTPIGPRGE